MYQSNYKQRGFTLIEIMIALSIAAIATTAYFNSSMSSQMNAFRAAESKQLISVSNALITYIEKTKIVPGAATWHSSIASVMSAPQSKIRLSVMDGQRIYIYPDSMISAGVTLPFNQSSLITALTPLTTAPLDPRVMIVSPMNQTVLTQASGAVTTAVFNAIWNQTGQSAEMTESDNLQVQRINLTNTFRPVIFNNQDNANSALYSIDGSANQSLAINASITMHLIHSSIVNLKDIAGTLIAKYPATAPSGYSFNGTWGSTLAPSTGAINAGAGAGGAGGSVGGAFNQGSNGQLSTWTPSASCSPTGTAYTLTVDASNANGDYYIYGGIAGVATDLGRVKSGRVGAFNITECELYIVVPKAGKGSTQIYVSYMPHNNLTLTVL